MAKGRGRRGATQKSARSHGINIHESVPLDEVDAFHDSRDKILLDDDVESNVEDDDLVGNVREVLSMNNHDESEDETEFENEDYNNEESVVDDIEENDDADLDRYRTMMLPAGYEDSLRRRAARDEAHREQEEEAGEPDEDEEEEDDSSGWGANKRAYYSGNTMEGFESDSDMDEDKARELEKNEAMRLQRQSRAGMSDTEFGLDSIQAEEMQMAADEQSEAARVKRRRDLDAIEETAADLNASQTPEELVALLHRRAPIVLALVDEFRDALNQLREEGAFVDTITKEGEQQIVEIAHLYIQLLSNYTMMLAFFFQLAATPNMLANPEQLLNHPVMSRLAQFKRALVEMKGLGLFEPRSADTSVNDDPDRVMGAPSEEDAAYEELGELEPDELEDLLADAKENDVLIAAEDETKEGKAMASPPPLEKKKKMKKAKAEKMRKPEPSVLADVAGVQAADVGPSKKSASLPLLENADAFGEPTQMRDVEMQDKAQRRRAVQFHASGLDTKPANRKAQLEGDMDIPYRDKRQIRDAVSTAKANRLAKSKETLDTGLSGADWGESDWDIRRDVMDEGEESNDDGDAAEYYDLVSSRKRARKAAQKDAYDQQRLASRVYDDEVLAPGDHRSIDYTIDKNKGLTASRPKSIRNPRLKRRLRYDRAKKRLSSTRAVYKGGQSALQGGYGGEASGISTHLVKSRKLGS